MTGEYFCRGIVSMRSWIIYCFNVIEFNNLVVVVKAAVADYGRASLMLPYGVVGGDGFFVVVVKAVVGRLRSCLPYVALRFCGFYLVGSPIKEVCLASLVR
jgi:hypothetical protein